MKTYGWKFPIQVDLRTGKIKTNNLHDDIKESIKILLLTKRGERLGRKNYGSRIHRFMFESIDNELITDISRDINSLISRNEPRIKDLDVNVNYGKEDFTLEIIISYSVIEINEQDRLNITLNLV